MISSSSLPESQLHVFVAAVPSPLIFLRNKSEPSSEQLLGVGASVGEEVPGILVGTPSQVEHVFGHETLLNYKCIIH